MEQRIFFIPGFVFSKIQSYVAKLSRKAEKLGLDPIALVEVSRSGHMIDAELGIMIPIVVARIDGETPKLSGWEFAGTIDHGQDRDGNPLNIIRAMEDVPAEFVTAEKTCAHCNTKRARKNTYIVRNETTGEFAQVGSTCMKDYLGHTNALAVAKHLQNVLDLLDDLMKDGKDLESAVRKIREMMSGSGGSGQMRVEEEFDLSMFLRLTYRAIRSYGWASRSKGGVPTADRVLDYIIDRQVKNGKHDVKLEVERENETEIVESAIEWARGLDGHLTNYLSNLQVLAERGALKYRDAGFAASMIVAYMKATEEEREREEKPESNFVGEIKKRQQFDNLTLETVIAVEGYYGVTYLHKFVDESGNQIAWFNSAGWAHDEGAIYSGKATVKKHEEFRGEKQTVITRARFEEVEAVAA